MKKITLLCLLLSISLSFSQILVSEDFEGGLSIPTGWTDIDVPANGEVWTYETGGEAPSFVAPNEILYDFGNFSGNYAMFNSDAYGDNGTAENSALTSPVFDCSTISTVVLTFSHFIRARFGGSGFIEVFNGTDWIEVAEYSETTIAPNADGNFFLFGNESFDVTSQLAGVSNAQVRFRWTGDWSFFWSVDNISVEQPTAAPNPAIEPFPTDETVDVTIDTSDGPDLDTDPDNSVFIAWEADTTGSPSTSFDVYLGIDPTNLVLLGTTPFSSVNITNIEYGTQYYWQIVAKNNVGDSVGSPVWTFTTEANPLSVDDKTIKTVAVYPNPFRNILTIDTKDSIDTIVVINQLGQTVLKLEKELIVNNSVDLSTLKKGLYVLNIKSQNKIQSIKVIKD